MNSFSAALCAERICLHLPVGRLEAFVKTIGVAAGVQQRSLPGIGFRVFFGGGSGLFFLLHLLPGFEKRCTF